MVYHHRSAVLAAADLPLGVTMKPRYQHDCDQCTYYGRMSQYDVYVCERAYRHQLEQTSVILRHGDEEHQYLYMPMRMLVRGLIEPYEAARQFILTSEGKQP